jgi:hypothetical protein
MSASIGLPPVAGHRTPPCDMPRANQPSNSLAEPFALLPCLATYNAGVLSGRATAADGGRPRQ